MRLNLKVASGRKQKGWALNRFVPIPVAALFNPWVYGH
jgi:hypothetical protein